MTDNEDRGGGTEGLHGYALKLAIDASYGDNQTRRATCQRAAEEHGCGEVAPDDFAPCHRFEACVPAAGGGLYKSNVS